MAVHFYHPPLQALLVPVWESGTVCRWLCVFYCLGAELSAYTKLSCSLTLWPSVCMVAGGECRGPSSPSATEQLLRICPKTTAAG